MAEKFVTVAKYTDMSLAHVAVSRLQDVGIRATLTDELPIHLLAVTSMVAQFQIHVPESESQRAVQVLFDMEHEQEDPDWEANTDGEGIWLCTLCGSAIEDGVEVCPDCLTERGAVREQSPASRPMAFHKSPKKSTDALQKEEPAPLQATGTGEDGPLDDEVDLPDEDELRADSALARLAMGAAIGGVFIMPLTIYSIYILFKIAELKGSLTPRAERQVWWAVVLNIFAGGIYVIFFLSWYSYFRMR